MAGGLTPDWLQRQCAGAPADLVERTRQFLDGGCGGGGGGGSGGVVSAEDLARAGSAALAAAIEQASDRRGALDLLAADALVTLALAAQVERDCGDLERFAASLLATGA